MNVRRDEEKIMKKFQVAAYVAALVSIIALWGDILNTPEIRGLGGFYPENWKIFLLLFAAGAFIAATVMSRQK